MIRKLRKTDLDEVAYIWLHTNKKAHDFIAETYWDEQFEIQDEQTDEATGEAEYLMLWKK